MIFVTTYKNANFKGYSIWTIIHGTVIGSLIPSAWYTHRHRPREFVSPAQSPFPRCILNRSSPAL